LLTLLELEGSSLHHEEIQACGTEGTVRYGGIKDGKRGFDRTAPR